ncbi:MAG: alpha/beta hydrolase family protein, partial [Paracoccus hibiscisoli]|uniref:alpha/beta hydrolase family protein n=1 Tax=Paracoccus hibiscisoli TaxID=2023261 RepID=UPI00391A6F5E
MLLLLLLHARMRSRSYMSTPQANPEGYARSSVVEMAGKLPAERGRLLIVHGMLDENVLFRNTAALIAAM